MAKFHLSFGADLVKMQNAIRLRRARTILVRIGRPGGRFDLSIEFIGAKHWRWAGGAHGSARVSDS